MSLLADLLSKVKYHGENRDVPPGLKRIVSDSTGKDVIRKKIVIFSLFAVLAVAGGMVAVYFFELYLKPPLKVKSPQQARIDSATPPSAPANIGQVSPETAAQQKQSPATAHKTEDRDRETNDKPRVPGDRLKAEKLREHRPAIDVQQPAIMGRQQEAAPASPEITRQVEVTKEELKNSKGDRDFYLYTARTHESRKEYQQAFHNYTRALEIDNSNYIIMNNMSGVLLHMGNTEEAIKYSKHALGIRRDYVPSLINLGIAHIMTGNAPEGEGYLSKALSIEPSNSHAIFNIGLLFEKRGDNDKAYGYFFKLSEMGDVQGLLGMARVLEKQGRGPNAARVYRDIISTNGIDPGIKRLANERLLQLGQ